MSDKQQQISREELQAQLPDDFPPLPETITPETMQRYVQQNFGEEMPPGAAPLPDEFTPQALGSYLNQNFGGLLREGAGRMVRGTLIGMALSYMPMSNYHRRRVRRKLSRGQPVGVFEFVTGRRLTRGRIIGWVISLIIVAVMAYLFWQFNQTGELPAFLR